MRILCFVIILTMTITLQAQETHKVIPPSPNAASLGAYGNIPVGHYTGVPNINIPLYEIVSRSIKVPISLSYHAAGIRVAQEASWVGLGWTLNAGGIITRSVRGWDDLATGGGEGYPKGYPLGYDLPTDTNYTMPINGSDWNTNLYLRYAQNDEDPEPDIFYYNFGNYSGKILLQKGNKPLVLNQDPLKIEQFYGSCIIRTPDGNAYYFGTEEETNVYDLAYSNSRSDRKIQPNVVNSWYLDSIASPNNDKVIFKYKRSNKCIRSQLSATNSMFLDAPNGEPGIHWNVSIKAYPYSMYGYTIDSAPGFNFSETAVDEVLLDEIIFKGGRIGFTTKGRTDLIAHNSGIPQCLDAITIRNNLDSIIGSYQFGTSYFQSTNGTTNDQERLRLDQITDLAGKKHLFTYNSENLPKKTSSSVDHWGLYNGANNEAFDDFAAIPTIEYKPGFIYAGANREASQEKAKAAILTRIGYPTGGYTTFDYELNDFYNPDEKMGYDSNVGTLYGGNEQVINIGSATGIHFDITFTKNAEGCLWDGATCDSLERNDCYASYLDLQKKQENGTWATEVKYLYRKLGCIEGQSLRIGLDRTLSAGEYKIVVNSFETLNAVCKYRYAYPTSAIENKGGGLRVKEIETSDGENFTSTRYDYTMLTSNGTRSSGVLMSKPLYHYTVSTQTINGTLGMVDGSACSIDSNATIYRFTIDPNTGLWTNFVINPGYTKATSETIIPMGTSAQGSPVGYSQVTEIQQSTGSSNGKTVYTFSNDPEYAYRPVDSPSLLIFPGLPNAVYNSNGNLLKKEYWNSQDQLLKKEMYEYIRADSVYNVRGIKLYSLGSIGFWPDAADNIAPSKDNYLIRFYDNISERWNLVKDSTITYDYSISPVAELKQVNRYYYDNNIHKQLTRTITKNSDEKLITKTLKYPHDVTNLTDSAEAGRKKLLTNWNIKAVMEEDLTIGAQTQINQTEYESGFGLPKYIKTNTGPGQTMESRIGFQYDGTGNIKQYNLSDNVNTSYCWAYNTTQPVVKGENISYDVLKAAVESAAGTTNLETYWNGFGSIATNPTQQAAFRTFNTNLRSNATLNNAQITTYTYIPLVGMTSQTDPNGKTTYYEYDSFGRLKFIKDKDGKILKKFYYHYKN